MISVFGGTGFIGGTFCNLYPDKVEIIPKQTFEFTHQNILYFISTTTNQNIFNDLHVDIDTNLTLFVDILSRCKDKNVVFNFISSCFVYGNDVLNAKETDCCNPTGFYSVTKRCAEQLLISFCKTFGIKYRILRIGNVYGLDKTISYKKNVLGYMINLLKKNEDIHLYDGGNFLKDYIYVNDVCRAINLILESGEINQIYNIGSGTSFYFNSVIKNAKEILNSKSNLIDIAVPENQKFLQVKNMTLNSDKLKSLGFCNTLNFNKGLQILCDMV